MRMAAKGMQHIYKVLLQGYRDPDIVYDLDACRKLGNIVSVQDESVPDYDFERLMRVHAGDIAGRYIQTLYHKDMSDTEEKGIVLRNTCTAGDERIKVHADTGIRNH